jgi:hypothetical protein
MSYRHLSLSCACGQTPDRIVEVGFTDHHELVIHWWCSVCNRVVCVSRPLTECWKDCPEPEIVDDARFLQRIGVRFPDEG